MKNELFKINTDILDEYIEYEKINENWDIFSYLNLKGNIDLAIAFSKLYYPNIIKYNDLYFLESRFSENSYNLWKEELKNDVKSIEKMVNLYEVKDYFHINSDNDDYQKNEELSEILKVCWENNLKQLFADVKFQVELIKEDDTIYITFYQI